MRRAAFAVVIVAAIGGGFLAARRMRSVDVHAADERGITPLIMACFEGNVAEVKKLLAAKADPSRANNEGETPLVVAANAGDAKSDELVSLLLTAGANPNARTKDGRTALSTHATMGRTAAIKRLLQAGADPKTHDDRGWTPVYEAARNRHAGALRALLAGGGDPYHRNEETLSPLGAAIVQGDIDVVRVLLAAEVDPNVAVHEDRPALLVAVGRGDEDVMKALIEAGAALEYTHPTIGSALAAASVKKDGKVVEFLLRAGVPLELATEGGVTALQLAALNGNLAAVQLLVAAGADVFHKDAEGNTALSSATARGHAEIARVLEAVKPPKNVPKKSPPAPFATMLPMRQDASIRKVIELKKENAAIGRIALPAPEAPSAIAALRAEVGPELGVDFTDAGRPDPRKAIRTVKLALWSYGKETALEKDASIVVARPSDRVIDRVVKIAERPYVMRLWSDAAKKIAGELAPEEVAAVMVHAPAGPNYLLRWEWAFRVQAAAAIILSYRDEKILEDIADGPVDWVNTAAIIGFVDIARRDPNQRARISRILVRIARRQTSPVIFQHVVQPAALASLEVGGLDTWTAGDLLALALGEPRSSGTPASEPASARPEGESSLPP